MRKLAESLRFAAGCPAAVGSECRTNRPRRLDDEVILQLYRSAFLRRHRADRPKLRSSWLKLANGKQALLWSYYQRSAAPRPVTEKYLYITVVGPAHVFGLFARVPAGQSEASVRRVLVRTLGSLTFSDEPFNIVQKRCDRLVRTPCTSSGR